MRTISTITVLVFLVIAGPIGCANYTEPLAGTARLSPQERNFRIVWKASMDVLKKYHFRIDRHDPRDGVITTFDMTGQNWFECWREDAATRSDLAEASLQTIYRTVTVTIRPTAPDAKTYYTFVDARTKRSDLGTPQVSTVSEAYDLFQLPGGYVSKGRRWFLEDYGLNRKGPGVIDLGRDHALEAKIQADIIAAAGRAARKPRPSVKPQPVPAP